MEENIKAKWILHQHNIFTDFCFWNKWSCSNCGYVRTEGWEHTQEGKMPKAKYCEECGAEIVFMNDIDKLSSTQIMTCRNCSYRSDIRDDTGLWICNRYHVPIGDHMLDNYCSLSPRV